LKKNDDKNRSRESLIIFWSRYELKRMFVIHENAVEEKK